ncbi:MAG: hypothetical protein JWO65_494 [Sphingomonas bacterium]|nr:hypothetical protein [Sphingomonas bacterium]
MIRPLMGGALYAAASTAVMAQAMPDMPGMDMPATTPTPKMHMGDGVSTGGSGTSRLPANDAMTGLHVTAGNWMLMAHGYAWGSWTDQGGRRGSKEAFVQSMAMIEASRPIGAGVDLTLRSMVSLDPLMGERGYPDLFASGETAHGLALVDRQHPHDLFMEMSGRIDVAVSEAAKAFVYAGLPGEPALGPSAFMHRGSARFDPEAPITHHWFDSTHIAWGVATLGYGTRQWQIEASAFKGREPGENRYNIETPKLDSWAVRATWTPSPEWSAEISYGALHSPEALHPEQNERRLIASASYSAHGLDVSAGYSRKAIRPGDVLPAWLAEATYAVTKRHAIFGRFENVRNAELFERDDQLGLSPPLAGMPFRVSKFTAGYAYTLPLGKSASVALGGAASAYARSERLDAAYGRNPHSFTLFAKLMLGN